MSRPPSYLVITPVRNERDNLPKTISSFVQQSLLPNRWVLVDDGSTDGTAELVDEAADKHDWITAVHRADRGFRKPGTGVVEAFYDGLAQVETKEFDYIVKFDGDLDFESDYFARCFQRFDQNLRLGIGGGTICRRENGGLSVESSGDPAFHVRGATKIYRKACWDQLGGLIKAPGWDTVDELKANMLGWQTMTFSEIQVLQLKDTGSADGNWRNWVKNGVANYNSGYHPVFMAAKCLRRVFRRPYGLGGGALAWGYVKACFDSTIAAADPELVAYVHRQQINCLMGRSSLWSAPADNK